MRFHYHAEKENGEKYSAVAEAPDRFQLYDIVRREGGKVISIEEEGKRTMSFAYLNAKFSSVPEQQKIVFARNLSAMLSAGLALTRALTVLERQAKNARLNQVLSSVASDVRRGETLYTALNKFPETFSRLFVSMVRAGEESGDLPRALMTISEQMEQIYTLKKKVKGAMMYPSIVVIAMIGIGVLMLTTVVPTLAQTFEELHAELPASTQAVITISDFLVEHTVIAAVLFVIVVACVTAAMRTSYGRRAKDYVVLAIPVIGTIVREVNSARTARTLNSLLASGVDMLGSIEITREVVQNSYFKEVLTEAHDAVARGEALSKTFARHEKLYPSLVGEMISVGEETGELAGMLGRLATFYEDEVSRKTKDLSTIIEPFLMVIIGSAVGFFALSMIAPIYSLSENL